MLGDGLSDKKYQKIEKLFSKTYWNVASHWVKETRKTYGPSLSYIQWWECHQFGVQAALSAVARRYAVDLDYVAWFNRYVPEFNAKYGAFVLREPGSSYGGR
jgi:hypothetical protein